MTLDSIWSGFVEVEEPITPIAFLLVDLQDCYLGCKIKDDLNKSFIVDAVSYDPASHEIVFSGLTSKSRKKTYARFGLNEELP